LLRVFAGGRSSRWASLSSLASSFGLAVISSGVSSLGGSNPPPGLLRLDANTTRLVRCRWRSTANYTGADEFRGRQGARQVQTCKVRSLEAAAAGCCRPAG
jgi:hypothetical protein